MYISMYNKYQQTGENKLISICTISIHKQRNDNKYQEKNEKTEVLR